MSGKVAKGKSKFTFFDVVLIAAIIVVAALIVYNVFIADGDGTAKDSVEVEYRVLIEKIKCDKYSLEITETGKLKRNFLENGEKVYLSENSAVIGEIVSVTAEPYKESTGQVNSSGELIYCEYPGYVNIIITIKAGAVDVSDGFEVSGYKILSNGEIEFRTPTYIGEGRIISAVKKDKEAEA
jgi:hypothetical protein